MIHAYLLFLFKINIKFKIINKLKYNLVYFQKYNVRWENYVFSFHPRKIL
jgi:hypothetical protein